MYDVIKPDKTSLPIQQNIYSAEQIQKAINASFSSNKLLPFGFAEQYCRYTLLRTYVNKTLSKRQKSYK